MLDHQKQRDQESEIADAVNNECFLAGSRRGIAQEEKSNQQIRRQPHAFPAHKHQQVIAGQNQRQHEEHKQVQIAEEAIVATFLPHVSDGIPTPVTISSITSES